MRFRSLVLATLLVAAGLLLPACSDPASSNQTPSSLDRDKLSAALTQYRADIYGFDRLRAMLVATEDQIVFEQYYATDEDAYRSVQSITKSVVSTLIGIALDEGLIHSLDDTLAKLLPEYAAVMSPTVAGTTLDQLLTMTAGFPSGTEAAGPTFIQSKDWVRNILTHPQSPPGERFLYSNGTSHLLAAVLTQATGTSLLAFARSRLFGPLGIDTRPAYRSTDPREAPAESWKAYENAGFAWPEDPQGVNMGWWGLKLRPRDMVKLGQLFLKDGRWGNEQLVSADWVDEATTQRVAAKGLGDGYGYQWWTATVAGDEAFAAMGYGGQIIQVVPDRNVVVVTATEQHEEDPSSSGLDNKLLLDVAEDEIISRLPDH